MAQDETHLHLLPHIRASWTLRRCRPKVATPGKNRQITVYGALNLTGGRWFYRLGRRRATDFIALCQQLTDAYPHAPKIVVICDNDSIHHARAVTAYLADHPRPELLYGARYSPHDNPIERIWATLKAFIANTAAPWTSPWLPPDYEQNFWNAA